MSKGLLGRPTSRREILRGVSLGTAAAFLAGCAAPGTAPLMAQDLYNLYLAQVAASTKPPMSTSIQPALRIPDVPLEMKIGQMLMLGFRGAHIGDDPDLERNLRDQYVGSVVLFDLDLGTTVRSKRNIESPEQLKELTADLQSLARLPLLISIDQEGGIINRLKESYGFPATESHASLGQRNDPDYTRERATAMAKTLADVGINLNLAPVVDVAVNPFSPIIARVERSFSADPQVVAEQAAAFIDGHHAQNVLCTLKHFPGHGSALGDTHLGFVDVTHTWGEGELTPYRHLIAKGKVDAIMTAHIFNAKLDPDLPATLSPAIITGLLREQLGYDGVVISDDIQMRAITERFTLEKAFELAILAGVDIIAIANNVTYTGAVADRFVNTVLQLVERGVISESRIDASYRRIMTLKGLHQA